MIPAWTLIAILLATSVGSGFAQEPPTRSATGPIGWLGGLIWEDGGWDPPLVIGDELHMVGTFVGEPDLRVVSWEPESYAYTFWVHGLTARDELVHEDSRRVFYNGPGKLMIYREPEPGDYDFGVNPPNDTSPGSFTDGLLVLECDVAVASVQYNDVLGNAEASISGLTYVGGEYLDELLAECGECLGWVRGGASADSVPSGYVLEWNGSFQNQYSVAVESESWGRVKSLYR